MKRKILALTAVLTAALGLAQPVSADVIWTPENRFYERHSEECEYSGRCYEVRGCQGEAQLFAAPDGMCTGAVENGTAVQIQFVWSGQQDWGFAEAGWIPMDDLSLIYDSQQFMQDHADEIDAGEPVDVDFNQAVLYDYPNGPKQSELEERVDYLPFDELFDTIYTDGNGQHWGYVGYYMGRRNAWVCLDDPMNRELSTAVVATQPSAAELRGTPSATGGTSSLLLPAVLVAAVAAGTVVLIRVLCPKRK